LDTTSTLPHWIKVLLDLLSQITGGRGGIDHVIVNYVIAGMLYAALYVVARNKYRTDPQPREHMLQWGFGFGMCREFFMLSMAVIEALGWVGHAQLHAIFPPFEHMLRGVAFILIAGAFLNYLINDASLTRRYIQFGVASVLLAYAVTAWPWAAQLAADPKIVFGKTWYDLYWHANASIWIMIAGSALINRTSGTVRNWVITALALIFLHEFLKIPDILLNEVYEKIFAPIRVLLYLVAIPILGYIYVREQSLERLQNLSLLKQRSLEVETALQSLSISNQKLSDSEELLQVTFDSIGDAVITTDTQGRVQWLNPVAERLTGWLKSEVQDLPLAKIYKTVDDNTREPVANAISACLTQNKAIKLTSHTSLISRYGHLYPIEESAAPICGADGKIRGAVLVFHDVSEKRRSDVEIKHRATRDMLTGLINRTEFESRLSRTLENVHKHQEPSVLLFIDLDQFKVVNDACGHSVGDQLLRQVSILLESCVREQRDVVARLGGDEFSIILEHCDITQAQHIAQIICDKLDEYRYPYDGRRFRVGASIGLVPIDQRWSNIASLMKAADISCYAAKEAGRNRLHVWVDSDSMMNARAGEMQWVNRIEHALDNNRFELFGQRVEPIAGRTEALHIEVLLRLREFDGSLILPEAFFPSAERFHLATRIDRWVLRNTFDFLSVLQQPAQLKLLSINLSGHSISDRVFQSDVLEMIHAAQFPPNKLCFEITETAAITNIGEAKKFIDTMRALGVKIALDDFGAGASSFSYLKVLPVDYLKIDGHFVTHLLNDQLAYAAVNCFKDVAKILGITTVAEFVEREDTRQALEKIGIDLMQGHLIHQPEPLLNLFQITTNDGIKSDPESPIFGIAI
jgi:diguanylate cyclase (GGDEF)-like protein/PAS domain S-box-containing protein